MPQPARHSSGAEMPRGKPNPSAETDTNTAAAATGASPTNPLVQPTAGDLAGGPQTPDWQASTRLFVLPEPGDPGAHRTQEPIGSPFAQLPSRFGDYELLEEIARGGMGVVYKARQLSLDRVVALKMILARQLASEESVQRFYREARAAAGLDHSHIVAIHDIGHYEGRHFYTMAYVEGTDLREMVKRKGVPPAEQAVAILLAVTEAVGFAHERGIIHRDLKPENVLIDVQGRARVADFGLAKQLAHPGLTAAGEILGTPCYMPPEQAQGEFDRIGACSDVYSLGGVLYFLLTGHAPFEGTSALHILHQVLFSEPVPPRQLNPRASARLEAICLKCLEKDPARRYLSAGALAEALRGVASGEGPGAAPHAEVHDTEVGFPVSTRDTSRVVPLSGRTKQHPRLWWAGLAAGLVGLVAVGVLLSVWWFKKRAQGPTPSSEPADGALTSVVLPENLRTDFKLDVTMLGARPAEEGVLLLESGDRVKFSIKVDREAYVGVWTVEADGTVLQLFPNADEPDHLCRAGAERIVPRIGARAVPSKGLDRVWVEAATKAWEPVAGERLGPFRLFKEERDKLAWVEQRRGLRIDLKDALSEQVLRYKVKPRQ